MVTYESFKFNDITLLFYNWRMYIKKLILIHIEFYFTLIILLNIFFLVNYCSFIHQTFQNMKFDVLPSDINGLNDVHLRQTLWYEHFPN